MFVCHLIPFIRLVDSTISLLLKLASQEDEKPTVRGDFMRFYIVSSHGMILFHPIQSSSLRNSADRFFAGFTCLQSPFIRGMLKKCHVQRTVEICYSDILRVRKLEVARLYLAHAAIRNILPRTAEHCLICAELYTHRRQYGESFFPSLPGMGPGK